PENRCTAFAPARNGSAATPLRMRLGRVVDRPPTPPNTKGRLGATLSGNLASRKTEVKAASRKETPPFELLLLFGLRFGRGGFLFQGCSQDIAQGGAGVGRAILRDRLLLLGDLHRLDREIGLDRKSVV